MLGFRERMGGEVAVSAPKSASISVFRCIAAHGDRASARMRENAGVPGSLFKDLIRLRPSSSKIDFPSGCGDFEGVSATRKTAASPKEKTPGSVAVARYRPVMNKLSDEERRKLLARAMVTIYGQPENADRR